MSVRIVITVFVIALGDFEQTLDKYAKPGETQGRWRTSGRGNR